MAGIDWNVWSRAMSKGSQHHQGHLLPIISAFIVIGFLVLLSQVQLDYSTEIIVAVGAAYVTANSLYAYFEKTLSWKRVAEFFLAAGIITYAAISYL